MILTAAPAQAEMVMHQFIRCSNEHAYKRVSDVLVAEGLAAALREVEKESTCNRSGVGLSKQIIDKRSEKLLQEDGEIVVPILLFGKDHAV